MKPTELRIGNYIQIDFGNREIGNSWATQIVDGILLNSYEPMTNTYRDVVRANEDNSRDRWYCIDNIRPIPLTEEWLVKFGFEFWLDELGVKTYFKVYGIEYLCVSTNGFWQIRSGLNSHNSAWRMGQNYPFIIYVHQLQNLYFALTGQELTIKTK